jgi:Ni,Fe-hydrogenase I small subunit
MATMEACETSSPILEKHGHGCLACFDGWHESYKIIISTSRLQNNLQVHVSHGTVGDIHPMFQSMGMDVSHGLMSNMTNMLLMRLFIIGQRTP